MLVHISDIDKDILRTSWRLRKAVDAENRATQALNLANATALKRRDEWSETVKRRQEAEADLVRTAKGLTKDQLREDLE